VNRQFISTQEPLASLRSSRCQQCGWIPSCFIRVACVKFRSFSMGWAQVVLSGHDSRIRRETRKRDVDNFTLESYPNHDGSQGLKLYSPAQSCCEICSRQSECCYWTTPSYRLPNPPFITNGCELFYDTDVEPDVITNSTRI